MFLGFNLIFISPNSKICQNENSPTKPLAWMTDPRWTPLSTKAAEGSAVVWEKPAKEFPKLTSFNQRSKSPLITRWTSPSKHPLPSLLPTSLYYRSSILETKHSSSWPEVKSIHNEFLFFKTNEEKQMKFSENKARYKASENVTCV